MSPRLFARIGWSLVIAIIGGFFSTAIAAASVRTSIPQVGLAAATLPACPSALARPIELGAQNIEMQAGVGVVYGTGVHPELQTSVSAAGNVLTVVPPQDWLGTWHGRASVTGSSVQRASLTLWVWSTKKYVRIDKIKETGTISTGSTTCAVSYHWVYRAPDLVRSPRFWLEVLAAVAFVAFWVWLVFRPSSGGGGLDYSGPRSEPQYPRHQKDVTGWPNFPT